MTIETTASALGSFAEPEAAAAHFAARLSFETDPSDVAAALGAGERIQLVDVRGADAWNQGHVVGAVHLPRAELDARLGELDPEVPTVVYCWGPACNGGAKAAHLLASRGRRVKEMLGGFEYWAREGLPVEGVGGPIHRAPDPLTGPVAGSAAMACDC